MFAMNRRVGQNNGLLPKMTYFQGGVGPVFRGHGGVGLLDGQGLSPHHHILHLAQGVLGRFDHRVAKGEISLVLADLGYSGAQTQDTNQTHRIVRDCGHLLARGYLLVDPVHILGY